MPIERSPEREGGGRIIPLHGAKHEFIDRTKTRVDDANERKEKLPEFSSGDEKKKASLCQHWSAKKNAGEMGYLCRGDGWPKLSEGRVAES